MEILKIEFETSARVLKNLSSLSRKKVPIQVTRPKDLFENSQRKENFKIVIKVRNHSTFNFLAMRSVECYGE